MGGLSERKVRVHIPVSSFGCKFSRLFVNYILSTAVYNAWRETALTEQTMVRRRISSLRTTVFARLEDSVMLIELGRPPRRRRHSQAPVVERLEGRELLSTLSIDLAPLRIDRSLVAGARGEVVAGLKVTVTGNAVNVSHLELDNLLGDPTAPVADKLYLVDGCRTVATFVHPANNAATFVNVAPFTLPKGSYEFTLKADITSLLKGGASGTPLQIGLVGDPAYAAVVATANGTPLSQNDGIAVDNVILIGTPAGQVNADWVYGDVGLVVQSEISNICSTGAFIGTLKDGVQQNLASFKFYAARNGAITIDEPSFVLRTDGIIDTNSLQVGNSSWTSQARLVTDDAGNILSGLVDGVRVGPIHVVFAMYGADVNTTAPAGGSVTISLRGVVYYNSSSAITTLVSTLDTKQLVWQDSFGTMILGVDQSALGCLSNDGEIFGSLLIGLRAKRRCG